MKNVWILERFVPVEETIKHIADLYEMLINCDKDEDKKVVQMMIDNMEKKQEENPEGYWLGYEGKMNYNDFCYVAKEFMKRQKNDLLKSGVRVVKAQIEDSAKYWTNYKNAVVNDGVTRYLYATYK